MEDKEYVDVLKIANIIRPPFIHACYRGNISADNTIFFTKYEAVTIETQFPFTDFIDRNKAFGM